ncbi:MAG: DUF3782 domain-containing protein [Methylovulum sp.]|uniref:DUF3782 domain-containing protein n=1 Tax=Methylovulum sp. TaxID=1916980 RepID=UPI00263A0C2E|nr:DUF3782 domain-containing protein [Methylovulum sp.]MDD2724711.1 DUF3782 domain-containing protein [Methylovulum sp.]MDD5124664.1 DUF3782 domain-containing protein [Methylovulum sp.]
MTDEELRQLVASLAIDQKALAAQVKATSEQLKETDLQVKATSAQMRETDVQMKKTDHQIKELGKQIGGLGEKFGSFTEGMAFPSMQKVLAERFGMEAVTTRYKIRKGGKTLELDVFAYCNAQQNKAVIVEVKSHLRDEHIEQLLKQLTEAKTFLPEHADKQFYGILAVVDSPEDLKQRVFDNGLYYAEIHDNLFELKTPATFAAKAF